MKGIKLNDREELKYMTIKNVVSGRTTKKRAEAILGLTRRQIDRLVIKYNLSGKEGFVHGNKKRTNTRKTKEDIENKNIELYKNEYFDFSILHFQEILKENHTFCKVQKWLLQIWIRWKAGICSS